MPFIKNKQSFLLSLFLFLPATIQCMEVETAIEPFSQPPIIQEIQKIRLKIQNIIAQNAINAGYYNFSSYGIPEKPEGPILTHAMIKNSHFQRRLFLSYIYCCNYTLASLRPHNDQFTLDCLKTNDPLLITCKKTLLKATIIGSLDQPLKYSALGIVAITPHLSSTEKKDTTQKLLALDFKPIPDDDKMAILELWERRQEIIKKLHIFNAIENEIILKELITLISQLMIKTELLF